jgi:hypothetical protein
MAALVSPLLVLRARAEARAILYGEDQLTFEEAVHPLRIYAIRIGLLDQLGHEIVEAVILDPFQRFISE